MKLKKLGKNISNKIEIHTSSHGVWLLVADTEYFLSFKDYPWFKNARLVDLYNIEFSNGQSLRWPKLDVDLELESLKNPEKYPLTYKD